MRNQNIKHVQSIVFQMLTIKEVQMANTNEIYRHCV